MSDGQDKLDLSSGQQEGRVEEYKFAPIKGYPMLNWRGKRPFSSTQFYPAQLKEVHGADVDGWRNKIFWGDNLQVMSHLLKDFRGRIDLIYIDPPFDSKADYKKKISLRGKSAEGDYTNFEEKQYSDIWNNDDYLQFIFERLILAKELLSESGSIYLHCDWHKSHHLRCLMDEVFGQSSFSNEIIWLAEGGGTSGIRFSRKHQTIFYYTKSNKESERIFRADDVRVAYKTENIKPQTYSFEKNAKKRPGFKDGYTWTPNEAGKIPADVWLDCFLAEGEGIPLDVWSDIKGLYGPSGEIVGYPTQKPLALLDRIIKASSNSDSIVLDFFMGSGTTMLAAQRLGRRFIGADINLGAIQTTCRRLIGKNSDLLDQANPGFEVFNVNNYDVFRNPIEAASLVAEALEVQVFAQRGTYDGEKDGRMVKIMPVNRIATKADLADLVAGFDQKVFQRRQDENPRHAVEKILLVCMGHEPDLKAELELQARPFKIDVEVVDILRDRSQLEFKRDAEAKVAIQDGELVIENYYPMNLLQKLSLQQEQVGVWRELVDSVMVDWNYDGAVLQPAVVDVPGKDDLVVGRYKVPADAGTIRVKITDLLSESWERNIDG
ncbi:DNA methylase [Sphingopyxis sp. Root1497]|uniref:site-specific DNA-methyltransferase n=1 Tax=Sphingopyxis sp. Root1497 TaxID=1736474 RepID=UPI0006FB311E|nr:site-specific DNA-methyltransferase [Sphingopyxis sp. Root1497]KQZ64888.1 DNA methylase [Sphingopyxis sp. Root1497]